MSHPRTPARPLVSRSPVAHGAIPSSAQFAEALQCVRPRGVPITRSRHASDLIRKKTSHVIIRRAAISGAASVALTLGVVTMPTAVSASPISTASTTGVPVLVLDDAAGSSTATAVNNRAMSAGWLQSDPQDLSTQRPAVWDSSGNVTALPIPEGALFGSVQGINDVGETAGGAVVSCIFAGSPATCGQALKWDAAGHVTPLSGIPGGTLGDGASAINNRGIVVGSSTAPPRNRPHAVRWDRDGNPTDLGTLPTGSVSRAFAVNQAGDAVGESDFSGGKHAVLWTSGGRMIDLGTLGQGELSGARGVNDAGQVVGFARVGNTQHAVLWDRQGHPTDLGILAGTTRSSAAGINEAGQIIGRSGQHAVLWDSSGQIHDLGAMSSPALDFTEGLGINNYALAVGDFLSLLDQGPFGVPHALRWDAGPLRP